ncbi:FAD-dependent oxidoreductase [Bacteroidota bacterium]
MFRLRIFILSIFILFYSSCNKYTRTDKYDIVVYGGTSAGVIAAYSATMLGKNVLLVEPGYRLGGLSSGGLGQTDIGNKHAVTGLSRNFYRRVGKHYGKLENWYFEPKVALNVFNTFIAEAGVPVEFGKRITKVDVKNGIIKKIYLEDSKDPDGATGITVSAEMFIDCSYEGDLMAKAGISYTIGREANNKYSETYNGVQLSEYHQFDVDIDPYIVPGDPASGLVWGISPDELQPTGSGDQMVQAYNFRICLTDNPDNLIPITKPENYNIERFELLARLINAQPDRIRLNDYFIWSMMPNSKTDINNRGAFSTDMIGMNYTYPEGSYEERKRIINDHVDYTKGLLFFLGNDSRVPDTLRQQMQQWGYPADEYVETGYWTPQLYIREARRMLGAYVMTEHHCTGDSVVSDPIGLAAYTMDSHNCQRIVINGVVKNEGDVEIGGFPPYPISYRSLLPKKNECTNLIVPVCLSASHIAFGSIRMEPVFMVLGQVSGIAATMAIDNGISLHNIDYNEINAEYGSNPLLDGTPSDIIVDNEDEGFTLSGDWTREKHFMRNFRNSLEICNDGSGKAEITLKTIKEGLYDAYFYCPLYSWTSDRPGNHPEMIKFNISSSEFDGEVEISYKGSLNNWAKIGQYELGNEEEITFTLSAIESNTPLIADALMLIPVSN